VDAVERVRQVGQPGRLHHHHLSPRRQRQQRRFGQKHIRPGIGAAKVQHGQAKFRFEQIGKGAGNEAAIGFGSPQTGQIAPLYRPFRPAKRQP